MSKLQLNTVYCGALLCEQVGRMTTLNQTRNDFYDNEQSLGQYFFTTHHRHTSDHPYEPMFILMNLFLGIDSRSLNRLVAAIGHDMVKVIKGKNIRQIDNCQFMQE